jgi:hypothetical protein
MKTIKVIIAKDGTPTLDAVGFNGVGCVAATKPIEEALGSKDPQRMEKPEIYGNEQEQQQLGQTW